MCSSINSNEQQSIIDTIQQLACNAHITSELMQYIQTRIFPQYLKNDKGHQLDHIYYVIQRSLLFLKQFSGLNADMVYTIAAYHDIAHHVDKNNHEVLSAKALQNDTSIKRFFTEEQLHIMKEAIEDHRASLEYQPRSDYGKIVSSADRSTDIDAFFRRTHAYSLKHFPEYSEEEHMERCYQHMKNKYGDGGYAKSYVIDDDYIRFLQTIQRLLADKDAFTEKYRAIASMMKLQGGALDLKYDIVFPTVLDNINSDNDNIDVLVQTENGRQYAFVIATPDNIKHLMQKDGTSYLKPGLPFLFVEKLTEDNIRLLLDSLLEEDDRLIQIYGEDI